MIREVSLKKTTFDTPPWKFEAGTPNVGGAVGLGAAVDYLLGIGMERIRAHEIRLTRYALTQLNKIKGVRIYGPKGVEDRGGVVAFTVEGVHPHDLATALDQDGIAIRSGHHCAMPLHNRLGLTATVRASFYLYNTKGEIGRLVEGIKKAKKLFRR